LPVSISKKLKISLKNDLFFRTLLLTLALAVAIFGVCKGATEKEETKYAPSYCLRFKLNCSSEQKKKHVCCLYPLPGATFLSFHFFVAQKAQFFDPLQVSFDKVLWSNLPVTSSHTLSSFKIIHLNHQFFTQETNKQFHYYTQHSSLSLLQFCA
jgi:hypothetical protein